MLWLWAGVPLLSAQATNAEHCVVIHVRLNGKALDGPQSIAIRTKIGEELLPLTAGCFSVPANTFKEARADMTFELAGNRIHLSAIPTGFFVGSWDIELEDQHFGKDVILPKNARIPEACTVVFHVGDPETRMSQGGCRKPSGAASGLGSNF